MQVAETYPDKPFIISETGAGGIVGMHSNNNQSEIQTGWSPHSERLFERSNGSMRNGNGLKFDPRRVSKPF
jgi:hypothetical protein